METFFLVVGILLLFVVTADIMWTALWVEGGAGPLSNRLTSAIYKLFRKLGGNHMHFLSAAGPIILIFTLLTWVLLTWCGWLFIFSGGETFIDTRDDLPLSWTERIYYTGYLIFTLGVGDYVPKEGIWQVITALAAGNGFLFITLGASYVLNVLDAVTMQRSFASTITGIGKTGSDVVESAWNGKNFHNIDLLLNSVSSQLSKLAAQHKAYPILHFYHSANNEQSAAYAIAILDEALTLMEFGIPKEHQPNTLLIKEARSSVKNYVETLAPNFVKASDHSPPRPSLDALRDAGLPVDGGQHFEEQVEQLADRRKKMLGILESGAREWPSEEKKG